MGKIQLYIPYANFFINERDEIGTSNSVVLLSNACSYLWHMYIYIYICSIIVSMVTECESSN